MYILTNTYMLLRTCQIDALTACKENEKGIIRMCCGSGKTMVEIELCLQENISCLVAPRNALLKQHILEFKKKVNYKDASNEFEYSFSTKTFELFTINCETDYENYKLSTKKVCFIINNSSLTKLPVTPDILIVDESHTHKMTVFKSKILKNVKRKYFFTATPQDMTDTDFYGPVINTYDYLQALNDKFVTKFKIVPIWKKENFHIELQEKMDQRNLTHCIHFYETVKENDSSHNLALSDVPIKELKNGQKITDQTKNRDTVFKNFKEKGGHLLSCKTISYGIDIPECDSVFLSYVGNSIPDSVQKMMRAIRLNNAKKDKVAYIFVLMDIPEPETFDEELDITSTIKELQQQLVFKISGILKEGLDLDILQDYHPHNIKRTINNLNEEKEELLEELELIGNSSESENEGSSEEDESEGSSVGTDNETQIKDRVKEIDEEIKKLEEDYIVHEETIKKSSFSDFFDDYQLQTWYVNGKIKSKINKLDEQWQTKFEKLKKLNGNMPSPKQNKSLNVWCQNKRSAYKKNKLCDERITLLESLSEWVWEKDLDILWQINFEELKKLNGKMPSKHSKIIEEKLLGSWCSHQRVDYKKNKLCEEKITQLESLQKWQWNVLDESWQIKFEQLKKLNGKMLLRHSKIIEEKLLSSWCSHQRENYKKNKLCEERINLLESLPEWDWDVLEETWQEKYEELKKLNGKMPSKHSKNIEEKNLGIWCNAQRGYYKTGKLSKERINQLESLSEWVWKNDLDEQWQTNFEELKKLNGKMPSLKENKTLNIWCTAQRENYKKNKLCEERINLLESLTEWKWEKDLDELWQIKFEELKKLNGKTPSEKSEENILYNWCNTQRVNYKKNKLCEERINLLESLKEWEWDLDYLWQVNFEKLKKLNGKMPSPKENKKLNSWCSNQRTNYKNNKLSEDRIKQLESLQEWEWISGVPINKKITTQESIKETSEKPTQQRIEKTPQKTVKPKNQTTEETIEDKIKDLSLEEIKALYIKEKLKSSSNYQAPNPVSKDQINKLFSENINRDIEGDIIVLDDIQFNSSKAVNNVIESIKDLVVPNNSKENEEMSNNEIFGNCVKKCSLQELLDTYISNQKPIKAIYADLMGSLSTEIVVLNQIKKCNLTKDCVVGFTISARSNTGANYTNEYAAKLSRNMYERFGNNNLIDKSGVYVYGEKVRMATCVFKINF